MTSSTISHLVIACIARPRLRSTFSRWEARRSLYKLFDLEIVKELRRARVASRNGGETFVKDDFFRGDRYRDVDTGLLVSLVQDRRKRSLLAFFLRSFLVADD